MQVPRAPLPAFARGLSSQHGAGHEGVREGHVERARLELRKRPECRFVNATAFRALLVSNRALCREDQPRASVRGLRDVRGRTLFLIEEELLFDAMRVGDALRVGETLTAGRATTA